MPWLRLAGLVLAVGLIQSLTGTTWLLTLERSRFMIGLLILLLAGITTFGRDLADRLLERAGLAITGVRLWAHPLAALAGGMALFLFLLVAIPAWQGRGIWSTWLDLNAKSVTVLFTTTSWGFFLVMAFETVVNVGRSLARFARQLDDPAWWSRDRVRGPDEPHHAYRANRITFYLVLAALLVVILWVVFFKPETILYYRGEIQVYSRVQPEVALETFRHLARKYPDYRYRDTVDFRAAWVLERRLKRHEEAAAAYEAFLKEWGFDNVWTDDVLTGLIRIHADQRRDPAAALPWIRAYRERFPEGHMAPHVALYEAKVLRDLGRATEARQVLQAARERFRDRQLLLYDDNDDFIDRVSFLQACHGLNLDE